MHKSTHFQYFPCLRKKKHCILGHKYNIYTYQNLKENINIIQQFTKQNPLADVAKHLERLSSKN